MGTILKYVFYLILIVVIFLVGRGIYEGSIDSDTTVGEVVEQVDAGAKNMVKSGSETVEKAADDYKKAPKRLFRSTKNAGSSQSNGIKYSYPSF